MQKLLPAHQRKWGGDYPPSPKSGGPIPLSPCSDAYVRGSLKGWGGATAPRNYHMKFLEVVCTALLEAVLASESQYKSE